MDKKGNIHGMVVRSTGSWYQVLTDDGRLVACKVKGNFRLRGIRSTNPVAVGDGVHITEGDADTAFIVDIDERKNYIIRKASNLSKQSHILAANIDLALLMVTVAYPETTTTFIDRFLASAEAYRVPVVLGFNKFDSLEGEALDMARYLMQIYGDIGYPCFAISALSGEGLDRCSSCWPGKSPCWPAIRAWVNQPCSTSSFLKHTHVRQLFRTLTARGCTPPRSASFTACPTAERSSTFRG